MENEKNPIANGNTTMGFKSLGNGNDVSLSRNYKNTTFYPMQNL